MLILWSLDHLREDEQGGRPWKFSRIKKRTKTTTTTTKLVCPQRQEQIYLSGRQYIK